MIPHSRLVNDIRFVIAAVITIASGVSGVILILWYTATGMRLVHLFLLTVFDEKR